MCMQIAIISSPIYKQTVHKCLSAECVSFSLNPSTKVPICKKPNIYAYLTNFSNSKGTVPSLGLSSNVVNVDIWEKKDHCMCVCVGVCRQMC